MCCNFIIYANDLLHETKKGYLKSGKLFESYMLQKVGNLSAAKVFDYVTTMYKLRSTNCQIEYP